MRYRVVLSRKHYDALRDQLPEPDAFMGHDPLLFVDDAGRAVIESRLPGRVFWEAHQIPRGAQTQEASKERVRSYMERRRRAGLQ